MSAVQNTKADEKFGVGVSTERSFNSDDDTIPSSYCNMFSNCSWDDEEQNLEDLFEHSDFKMDKDSVKNILDRAANLAAVTESVDSCNGRKRMFNTEHLNLMLSPALFALGTCISKSAEQKSSEERLNNILSSYNMELVKSNTDGDCLFTSVIFGLMQIVSSKKYESYREHLKSFNLSFEDMSTSVLQLRKLLVSEWLANASEYENFVIQNCEKSFRELAESYKVSGVFAGELGNIMVIGLANVLGINIVLYTSMTRMETIPVVPREKALISCPIHLAFNHSGCGHYDAVVESRKTNTGGASMISENPERIQQESKSCRCGRGAAKKDRKNILLPSSRRTSCTVPMFPCAEEMFDAVSLF